MQHRRDERRERDGAAFDLVDDGLRVEPVMDHHGLTEIKPRHRADHAAGGEERGGRKHDVRAVGLRHQVCVGRLIEQGAVGVHHALGSPGGAAGVQDERHVVRGDVATPGAWLRLRQRRLVVSDQLAGVERRAGAHAQYQPQLGQFAQELLDVVGVDDHRSCTGVVAHVGDLVGSQPDVYRHRDQPGLCQTERDLWPFKAIAGDHHHPVAG